MWTEFPALLPGLCFPPSCSLNTLSLVLDVSFFFFFFPGQGATSDAANIAPLRASHLQKLSKGQLKSRIAFFDPCVLLL